MKKDDIANLTDAELIEKLKRSKKSRIFDAVMIGGLLGIAIFSAIIKGVGWVTFIPLVYIFIAAKNDKQRKNIKAEMIKRGL